MTQNIAVVGSGICGLCTALALSNQVTSNQVTANQAQTTITLFERDIAPPEGDADDAFFEWKRRGAAQFRHPHAFLGLMCSLLEQHYPDLLEDFWQAGARKIGFEEMLPPAMLEKYRPEPIDKKMWMLMCRRATMETVLRRYVERRDNITIENNVVVRGVLTDADQSVPTITGLKLDRRGKTSEFLADLVIDASGRTSKFKSWIEALDRQVPEESENAEIVYYTRHYKLRDGQEEPARDDSKRAAGDLGYLKFGVFPGEHGHFAVILCVPNGEAGIREAIKSGDSFQQICESIPGLARWVDNNRAEPTTVSFGFADIKASWKSFVTAGKPAALNFFAVGDASFRTNPLYGRGCSTGTMHAHLLAEILETQSDPLKRALAFDAQTRAELRPIWDASLKEDKRGISRANALIEGKTEPKPRGLKKRFGLALSDAISASARDQLHVLRGVMKTFNLLEKPGDFLKDRRIQLTVLRYLFRGRKRNAADRLQPGPSYQEMLSLVNSGP